MISSLWYGSVESILPYHTIPYHRLQITRFKHNLCFLSREYIIIFYIFYLRLASSQEYGISSADFHAEFAEKMCIAVLAFTSHRVARSMLHAPPPGLQVSLRQGVVFSKLYT